MKRMTENQGLLSDGETPSSKAGVGGLYLCFGWIFPFHLLFPGVKVGAAGRARKSRSLWGGLKRGVSPLAGFNKMPVFQRKMKPL